MNHAWTKRLAWEMVLCAVCLAGCEAPMAAITGRDAISPADFADLAAEPNVSESAGDATTFVDSDVDADPNAIVVTHHGDARDVAPTAAADVDDDGEPDVPAPTSAAPSDGPAAPAPSRPSTPSARPGQRVIVDSLIGQVNGRPIFADEFFEPIEDQILAARAQLSAENFLATMDRIIVSRLNQVIFNELVLAEAETMLTEETRVGLRYWLKDVEEKRLAESLGVRSRAEQELAEEGMTLDKYLEIRRDEAMIYTLVKKKIEPRVIVTWRDLEREYERREREFNPPASVTLAKIVLSKEREQEMIDAVETGLAEGKSLEEIGKSLERDTAYSEDVLELGPNGLKDLPLNPAILEAIADLKVGETSQPVEVELSSMSGTKRVSVYWYHIKSIDQREARTLYDPQVQRQLFAELKRRRLEEEQNRYLDSLLSKGIYDNIEEMTLRLRRVALIRYGRSS